MFVSHPAAPPTPRSPRLAPLSVALAALVVVAAGLLTTSLAGGAVRDRIHGELTRTAQLIGGAGFPLSDPALERMAEFIEADVVAVDATGRVVASSLDAAGRARFQAARAEGHLPAARANVEVLAGRMGGAAITVGAAPIREGSARGGAVYVLYPEDLVAAQARGAWLPVTAVAILATLVALAVGVLAERRVRRTQTSALLQLLASVAHEVRNPLGGIRTLATSLRRRLGPGAGEESLELIASEAERLSLLLDGLGAVGRPVRTLRRPVDPDREVAAVLTVLAPQLGHRRVRVDAELAGAATINGDPAQLRQVVMNLVLNAADALPAGGSLRVSSATHDGAWRLVVEDDGPGVPPEVADRLFEPFFTTKAKGLGVGLYLSRRLVEAHGGQLHLDATAPRGARFVVRWPLVAEARPAAESSPLGPPEAR